MRVSLKIRTSCLRTKRYGKINPWRKALTTAKTRLLASSLVEALAKWKSTVFSEMPKIDPISQDVFPKAQ